MKTRIKKAWILFAVSCILFSCQNEHADILTGITAKVYSGSGDCMPVIDYSRRTYTLYSGRVYIVQKIEYDNPVNTLETLKNKSISRIIKDGALSITLQPDSFVVFVDNGYESNSVIHVKDNQVIKTPFYFFHCTSY
jgi:hypothetical protein